MSTSSLAIPFVSISRGLDGSMKADLKNLQLLADFPQSYAPSGPGRPVDTIVRFPTQAVEIPIVDGSDLGQQLLKALCHGRLARRTHNGPRRPHPGNGPIY